MTHSMAELDLIVGVMSYGPQHARRQGMRDMCNCSWPGIALRFVMAIRGMGNGSVAEDAAAGDLLLFDVPHNNRQLGTYLLTNAFFRYAVGLRASFIARADDDAVVNVGAIAHEIALAAPRHRRLILGPFGEWYMFYWSSFIPSCWSFSPQRWIDATKQFEGLHRNFSAVNNPTRECVGPNRTGPFPLAKVWTRAASPCTCACALAPTHTRIPSASL